MAHRILDNATEFLERGQSSRSALRYWNGGKASTHYRYVLTMFLECNLGYPFSFKLGVQSGAARKCPQFFTIFNLFISESPRWRRVTLVIGTDDIPPLYHVKGQLEHLESLHLTCRDANYTVPETFTYLFMTAPCFTRLSLSGLSMVYRDVWSRTKRGGTASLHPLTSGATRDFNIYLGDETLPSITSIMLPSLLSLVTNRFSLLQAITTPSLKEWYVDTGQVMDAGPHPELVGALKSFFGRSRCHLQALKLENLNAVSVIEILSHAPDIRSLYLADVRGSVIDVFGWLNGMETPQVDLLAIACDVGCPFPARDEMYNIVDFVAQRKTRVGSVVEKLQKFGIM